MKITGYRSLSTHHDWGRLVGDVNGVSAGTRTRVDILVITTDGGVDGIAVGAHPDIERLFAVIDGADPRTVVRHYDRMLDAAFKLGHGGAVFGTIGTIDMALWDLKAKMADEPLWRLLGGADRFVPGYASGLEYGLTDQELMHLYQRFADRGFTAAKLKGGRWIQDDLRRLGLVREILGHNSTAPGLMLDANESWHRSQAVRHIAQIEASYDLTWVEEPVRRWDVAGHRAIRQQVRSAVASGENLTGVEQIAPLVAHDAVDIVQVGSGWGITNFLRVAHLAHGHDLPISPVGYTAVLAPAAGAVPNFLVTEIQDFRHPEGVVVDQEIVDGGIVLGDQPGLGLAIEEDALSPLAPDQGWAASSGPHVRPVRAGRRMVPEDDGDDGAAADER
jgi:L-alanine-DL-glutamate epimerase-like enolase superfamily enzyme